MTYLQLYQKFQSLPPVYQAEVADFIDFLSVRSQLVKPENEEKAGGTPVFGSAKGQFKMSPDFDAPLDDFADYQ